MKVIEITNDAAFEAAARFYVERVSAFGSEGGMADKLNAVRDIMEAVRRRGDAAVAEFTAAFDRVTLAPDQFEIPPDALEQAEREVDPDLLAALRRAYDNIRRFHGKSLRQSWEEDLGDGTFMGQRMTPIERVGVYVPGGTAFYPSSVLMNIAPASVAGVSEIFMVSPPSCNGSIQPLMLAAARIAGATRVFRVGGAQAVAALAYGTETIPAVSKITGPGNIYVTLAKRLATAVCAIDIEAGPSEVVVIADDEADPSFAAAELLAQAEHDADAVALLVTTSRAQYERIAARVAAELERLSRGDIIRRALDDFGVAFIVRDLDEAVRLTDILAPEHLSIQTRNPRDLFARIANAGAVMLGDDTPVAVTDYYAGPNHILPTGRRARFSSPLSAEDFRKVTNYVAYSRERLRQDGPDIMKLAQAEQFTAHARAVEVRVNTNGTDPC